MSGLFTARSKQNISYWGKTRLHFFNDIQEKYKGHGVFGGFEFEATPAFEGNYAASIALCSEIWHRERRDRKFKAQFFREAPSRSAIILFSETITEDGKLIGEITIDHANPEHIISPENVKRMIRRMDRIMYRLLSENNHHITLLAIARKFETDPKTAKTELKNFLKIYCRSRGFFINETDVAYALAVRKNRRREAYRREHPEHFN